MDWTSLINQLLEKKTQKEVADAVGCSQPFISLLSQGKRKNLDYDIGQKIVSLCVVNGISIYEKQKSPVAENN